MVWLHSFFDLARLCVNFQGINAAPFGVVGVLVYTDPYDINDGKMSDSNETYPHSWYLPPSGVERGSYKTNFGDQLTPYLAAKSNHEWSANMARVWLFDQISWKQNVNFRWHVQNWRERYHWGFAHSHSANRVRGCSEVNLVSWEWSSRFPRMWISFFFVLQLIRMYWRFFPSLMNAFIATASSEDLRLLRHGRAHFLASTTSVDQDSKTRPILKTGKISLADWNSGSLNSEKKLDQSPCEASLIPNEVFLIVSCLLNIWGSVKPRLQIWFFASVSFTSHLLSG